MRDFNIVPSQSNTLLQQYSLHTEWQVLVKGLWQLKIEPHLPKVPRGHFIA